MTTSSNQKRSNMDLLSSNYTEEFISRYLKELNIRTIDIMKPAIVFLAVIAILGAVGNSLVLIVYWRKRTSSPNRIFILTLSSFDLLTNVFVVPEEIYDMFDYWTFNRPFLCKARHYMYTCNTIASSLALLAISVTRFIKICHPFWGQVTVTHAKLACIFLTVLSLLFSASTAVMKGVKTTKTPRDGIYGYQCGDENAYLNTEWPTINIAFIILLFVLVCFPLVVLDMILGFKVHDSSIIASKSKMRAAINMFFILSFLAFLISRLFDHVSFKTHVLESMIESILQVFLRSYLLNTAANPVIYTIYDVNFRRECWNLLKFW